MSPNGAGGTLGSGVSETEFNVLELDRRSDRGGLRLILPILIPSVRETMRISKSLKQPVIS